MTPSELGAAFVDAQRGRRALQPVLDAILAREWAELEELERADQSVSVPPPWRYLGPGAGGADRTAVRAW